MNTANKILTILFTSLVLTACAKSDNNAQTDTTATEASAPVVEEQISAEQQALIDSIDQPILDDKNTDIPAEIADAPADAATPTETVAAASSAAAP